jgi:hypothetical protein
MITRINPESLGGVIARTFGQMIPPGDGTGIVVARQVEMIEDMVGIGCAGNQFLLKYSDGESTELSAIEIPQPEYEDIFRELWKDDYRSIGGVFVEDETLDGESYMVKYIDSTATTLVIVGHPREAGIPLLRQFADTLDLSLKKGRRIAVSRKNRLKQ